MIAVMLYLHVFISLYEDLGIIYSGLSIRLLQESSILEENITCRQILL